MKSPSVLLAVGLSIALAPLDVSAPDAALTEHTALRLETWNDWLQRSPRERVAAAPAAVHFYKFGASKLTSSDIELVYRELVNSDFVSLFAATNPFDDFAESYAMYAHVVLQDKPWNVQLWKAGSVIMDVDRPIFQRRCQLKRQYFDRLFGRESATRVARRGS